MRSLAGLIGPCLNQFLWQLTAQTSAREVEKVAERHWSPMWFIRLESLDRLGIFAAVGLGYSAAIGEFRSDVAITHAVVVYGDPNHTSWRS